MHRLISKYWAFLLLLFLLSPACQREQDGAQEVITPLEGVWKAIPYRATVTGSAKTKATLDAIDRHYLFERDDLLYVVDKTTGGDVVYGYLYLISGAGTTEAIFEGDLMYFVETAPASGVFEPERPSNNLAVTATLVSKAQRDNGVYTFVTNNEGKIDTGPNFGDKYASTFKEAVQKYSTFTADATYGNPSFSLVQGTAFLLFSLSFDDGTAGPLTVSVTNNNGAQTLFSHSVTPDVNYEASFVAAFPGGTITLSNAKLTITDGGSFNKEKALAAATLQGNRYYNVTKTFLNLDYFTIQAREAATTISFPAKYQDAAYGLQYSSDGSDWTNVSETSSFELAAGNSVMVRGKGSKYQNSDGTAPLFTSSAPCYIYGDIMSLFCDGSYNKKTAFTSSNNNALQGAFKDLTNLDIHPARPLLLSAQALAEYCYKQMFSGSSITRAPEFTNDVGAFAPTVLKQACMEMFKGCTSLTAAPELRSTTVAQEGYYGMFSGCTAMLTPPSRLAGTMSGSSACRQMFLGCSSLQYAPELPAMDIKANGYQEMFTGCTSLSEAPDLPATTINGSSYRSMFGAAKVNNVDYSGCTSMETGPLSLPATTMSNNCYQGMFKGCTLLEAAPRIDATTLADYCFQEMFSGCIALRTAQNEFSFTDNIPQRACKQMFYNCLVLQGAPDMPSVIGTIGQEGCMQMYSGCEAMTKAPSCLKADTVNQQGYYQMFYNCDWLTNAPSIEATNIGQQGCMQMFYDCLRLANPPASLLATTLGNKAYQQMFYNCTALTAIPDFPHDPAVTYELPDGTDKNSLCYQMFFRCNELKSLTGKKLFSSLTPMTPFCFEDMFSECRKLESVPTDFLPATSVAASCYRGMFQSTLITRSPDLPASTLASECYRYMFNGCSQLTYIKCLATTNIGDGYTTNWVGNNKTGGNVPNNSDCIFVTADEAAESWPIGYVYGILSNWTIKPVSEE